MRRLPPLNSLRAFESAARCLSFSKAAAELSVTPGAISQQIKTLEAHLGLKLFKRQNRHILLTDEAQLCLPYLSKGFDQLLEGMQAIQKIDLNKPLTITVADAFASRWLMPRLRSFQARHADIDVRIDATTRLVDLQHEDVDAGIRFGSGEYPGLATDYLLPQSVYPVCSPELLVSGPGLHRPEDLCHYTLLHSDYYYLDASQPDWSMWLSTLGVDKVDSSRGLRFSQSDMVVQAAIEGQGVALVGSVIVRDEIKAGRLVRPFQHRIPLDLAYYFVTTDNKLRQPRVRAFRDWLLEEVESEGLSDE